MSSKDVLKSKTLKSNLLKSSFEMFWSDASRLEILKASDRDDLIL